MKTIELVSMLANGVAPIDRHVAGKRFGVALSAGFAGAILLLVALYGIQGDMPQRLATPAFWVKAAFPSSVIGASLFVTFRLSRPGARTGAAWVSLAVPLAFVWLVAIVLVMAAPASLRLHLMLGTSWRTCTPSIAALSIPPVAAVFWAMKGLNPTRPMLAGAAAGLLGGAQALLVYTFYCAELAVPFWAVWYVLGLAIPTVTGGVIGRKLLGW